MIIEMVSSKKEFELGLSAWTRAGSIERVITFTDESYGGSHIDYCYSLNIKQISDFETAEGVVNSSCAVLEALLPNSGKLYPLEGRLIGDAMVTKIQFKNKKNDMHYFSSDIYFQQSLYESIEQSLLNCSKFRIRVDGRKYDENDEITGFHENEKSCLRENFVITRVSFIGLDEKIISVAS